MTTNIAERPLSQWLTQGAVQTGVLVEITAEGVPLIDYSGNELGPIPARTTISAAHHGDTLLLLFDQNDPARPIIIGIVRDRLEPSQAKKLRLAASEIVIEAAESVKLQCGESSLTLRKDGKATIKGKEVLSRASRTNRLRGASVQIN